MTSLESWHAKPTPWTDTWVDVDVEVTDTGTSEYYVHVIRSFRADTLEQAQDHAQRAMRALATISGVPFHPTTNPNDRG